MKSLIIASLFCGLVAGTVIPPGGSATSGQQNPCHAETARLRGSAGGNPPPGMHVPQCLASGWYNPQQSHGSTGHTWCVDPSNGKEVEGTRKGPGTGAQACPKCLTDKGTSLPEDARRVGYFSPTCDNTGHFVTKQFHGSTGYSWCVDRVTGIEVPDTRVGPGQSKPNMPC